MEYLRSTGDVRLTVSINGPQVFGNLIPCVLWYYQSTVCLLRPLFQTDLFLNTSAVTILGEPINFLILLDGISHSELFEARLIVEPELAARAAERATTEDLTALRQAIGDLAKSKSTKARLEADLAFHNAIFKA